MENVETRLKAYLTPLLITGFSIVMWSLINEIRNDVKNLLAANAETQTKMSAIERRLESAEKVIFSQRVFAIKPEEDE